MTLVSRSASLATTMLLCLAATSVAQQAVTPTAEEVQAKPVVGTTVKLTGAGSYQFESDISSGDENFSVQRYGGLLTVKSVLDESFTLYNVLGYQYASYDFSFSRYSPWEEIHTASYNLVLDYNTGKEWSFFGGAVVGYAGENDAKTDKCFTGGGLVGARYRFNPNLMLGLGVRVTTELEEDGKIAPLPIVDWKISDEVSLKSIIGTPGVPGDYGIELSWAFAPKWAVGGGVMTYYTRFRLKEKGLNGDGIGQDSGIPVFARIGYNPTENLSFSLIGGSVTNGQLRLETKNGNKIGEQDYDPAQFVGLIASYRF